MEPPESEIPCSGKCKESPDMVAALPGFSFVRFLGLACCVLSDMSISSVASKVALLGANASAAMQYWSSMSVPVVK
jgi:hypothetical protein